jgi:hypothetical protein
VKNQPIILNRISISLVLLIGFGIILYSCNSASHKLTAVKDTSQKAFPLKYPKHDEGEDDNPEPSLASILKDQLKSYKDTIKVDTIFLLSLHDTMSVQLRHYCTYDHKINLPPRYLKLFNLKKFQAHDFVSGLVKINSKVVFDGIIKKAEFQSLLNDELIKYAVLLAPNVTLSGNSLSLQYSISVPLSDVGQGFTMKIDTLGRKHITAD